MIEIMVALIVLTIGMLGIMQLQAATVRGNRLSRELEKAKALSAQMMEDLRGRSVASLGSSGTYPSVAAEDGTTYTRGYTVAPNPFDSNLVMITATTTFVEDGDSGDGHTARTQLMRTVAEAY